MTSAAKIDDSNTGWRRYRAGAVAALVLVGLAYGIFLVVHSGGSSRRRVLETVAIHLVPPPPIPVNPPPEPPKMVEEQKFQTPSDKPIDTPKDAPPQGPLALDTKGEAGGDAFGLGGKIGGSDFLNDGGGGTRFGHYAILMQDRITQSLHDDDKLNTEKFRVTIKVWLTGAGKIQRVQILHSTGDDGTDNRIEQVVADMPALPEAPPEDMPQPVIVRIGAQPGTG